MQVATDSDVYRDTTPSVNYTPEQRARVGTTAMVVFAVYTLLWEAFVWGGGMYVIISQDLSYWFVVLLMIISANQFKPASFRRFYGLSQEDSNANR